MEAENTDLEAENEEPRARVEALESQPDVEIADPADPIGSLHVGEAPIGRAINSNPLDDELFNYE